jgi:hypothetical protein
LAGAVQLVGIAILVFVKANDIETFRGFQIMKRKTAASGFAGNKGALSARFEYGRFQSINQSIDQSIDRSINHDFLLSFFIIR